MGTGTCLSLFHHKELLMTILQDPEENETRALLQYAGSLDGKSVLEIGCGDGRMTWRYAEHAAHVTGIDPDPARIQNAETSFPAHLRAIVQLHNLGLEDFAAQTHTDPFDLAILAWSL
jgi:cyclopropane fatty-acyl-phospholipid synthase-like methyltransferase